MLLLLLRQDGEIVRVHSERESGLVDRRVRIWLDVLIVLHGLRAREVVAGKTPRANLVCFLRVLESVTAIVSELDVRAVVALVVLIAGEKVAFNTRH